MDCMFSLEVMVLYSTHSKMLSNVREQIVEFCAFFVPYSTWEMLKVPLG
jgi:hypothetical protein